MDHPNIAKVLDGGATDNGRPYFIMELVRGIKITDYCDQGSLTTRQRLDLFIKVCQAIQHAHQKGIIHRDIKPSNILVTLHDGVAVPKVIDFGIAKATEGRLTDATVYTQLHQFIGTPAYMSPEQAEMSGLDIDTRSDIYSLGVLLYELLVGITPFDTKELMSQGIDAMRKTIREKDPLRPSTRLSRILAASAPKPGKTTSGLAIPTQEEVNADSRRRQRLKEQITRVRGDLDWIVMKCLEKDRARRYETANALAMDINRHLNTEPVEARPKSRLYEFRTTVRRHKVGFAAATALITVLTAGILTSTWEAVRATRAEQKSKESESTAHVEAARANEQKRVAEDNMAKAQKAEKEATQERVRANREAEVVEQNLYYAQMHLGQQVWREHRGVRNLHDLLAKWFPRSGLPDRRGWEWFYLNSLPCQNGRTLELGESDFQEPTGSERFCTVAWHAGSNRLAAGTPDGLIRIWDVDRETLTLLVRAPAAANPWPGVEWFCWSPDGDRLATGGEEGTVCVWDAMSGQQLQVIEGFQSPILSITFSSNGTRLAAWDNRAMRIWDANTGRLISDVTLPGEVTEVAWSPDDKHLATGYWDGTVIVSGTQAGEKMVTLRGHVRPVHRLAWSPDGARLASAAADATARIWDVASQRMVVEPLRHSHEVTSIAWAPDGRRLATGSVDETVKVWNATTGHEAATLRGPGQAVTSLSWGPGGRLASGCRDGSMRIWDSLRDQEAMAWPAHFGRATAVAWSRDGKRLASGGDDGKVRIWDPATLREVQTFNAHDPGLAKQEYGVIRSLAWSPDDTLLASAGLDGTARVWELASGKERFALPADYGSVWAVAWSPDGAYLAAGSEDGTIRLVEGLKHTPNVHAFRANESPNRKVSSLAWSPKGDWLAALGRKHLIIWDPFPGVERARIQHPQAVAAVAWSPDGKRLASSSFTIDGGAVYAWDAETGRLLSTMRGHNDMVGVVVWSPDGQRLASASLDHSVRIWDPVTGEETFVLGGNAGMFYDVSWNRDGAQLAAACSDGQIWIWDATSGFKQDPTSRPAPSSVRLQTRP
ncbi:MAG: hypothetical protein C5B50_23620 [Verrucomicrobia bacterium]|nr:MAG: hypothetical protein C5B50_23620 [Verrucomicrobiota bacterium]